MPTTYNVHMLGVHPLSMGFAVPEGKETIGLLEGVFKELEIQPIAIQVERNDDKDQLTFESRAWIKNVPSAMLLGIANFLDEEMDRRSDVESEYWDPNFVGGDLPFSMMDLAKAIVEERSK